MIGHALIRGRGEWQENAQHRHIAQSVTPSEASLEGSLERERPPREKAEWNKGSVAFGKW